ncbi:hypothetical protein FQN57_004703 [Myotisia sp. PD_48]|nr:hypothetical protein FQN57_004703 [Myotisia sp. PD_48]
MFFTSHLIALVALGANVLAYPGSEASDSASVSLNQEADGLERLSCHGSRMCNSVLLPGDCYRAFNKIDREKLYHTFGKAAQTGVCRRTCGIFVKGKKCDLRGIEMISAFKRLRLVGCKVCGVRTFSDGCELVVDFIAPFSCHMR